MLASLLKERVESDMEVRHIPIEQIRLNPYQPRKSMDKQSLDDLSYSIMQYGLIQPIAVRKLEKGVFELIAGERRLSACKILGMEDIPALIMEVEGTDSAVLALVENIQRENLTFLEEAEALSDLMCEHGLTQEQIADKIGKNQSTVANKIRILKLPLPMRNMIAENNLTERHARALLRLPDDKMKLSALKNIINKGLNVAQSEEIIGKMLESLASTDKKPKHVGKSIRAFKDIRIFTNTINQALDMIKQAGIEAQTEKSETDGYIEYLIKIPIK